MSNRLWPFAPRNTFSAKPFHLALVTGATSGLGTALARLLASKGIPLLLTGRNQPALENLSKELNASYIPLDLAQDRTLLLNRITEQSPDLVINNAGFTLYGAAWEYPLENESEIIEVNAKAPFEISLAAARSLIQEGKTGVILNIASVAALLRFPQMAAYAAAKAMLVSFSQSFDAEMQEFNIRILVSLPGQIATPFASRASDGRFKQTKSWMTMDPDRVAKIIWKQIEKRQSYRIIDWRYRIFIPLLRLLPQTWTSRHLAASILKRISH